MSVESSSTNPMLLKAFPRIRKELDVVWSSRSAASATGTVEVVLVEVGELSAVINLGVCDDVLIKFFPVSHCFSNGGDVAVGSRDRLRWNQSHTVCQRKMVW